MRSNATRKQIAAARKNIRKAIAARRRGSHKPNRKPAARRTKARRSTTRRQTAAQRRASLANLRKARTASKRKGMRKNSTRTAARRRAAPKRRRAATKRRSTTTRRRTTARRSPMRRNGRQTAAQRRASLANLRKARAASKRKGLRKNARRRSTTKRRATKRRTARRTSMRRNGRRQTAAQRRASLANLRKARAAQKRRGMRKNPRRSTKRRSTKRRTHRRNAWYGQPRRHAKAAKKGWSKRKSRRSGAAASRKRYVGNAKAFRKNQYMATLKAAVANGALITAGFAAHKGLSKILSRMVFDKLFGAPPTATTPAEAPAVSGLEMLQPYRGVIASAITAALGIGATNMVIRDTRTKMFVTGGMAASFMHTLLVTVLDRVSPQAASALSGADDAEAARLSAMYGLGAGTSILPHYSPIGEYFTEGVNGLGEYFSEHMSGLGAYGPNPDLYQAAAGYGAVNNDNSNHIDPSSDLDRELSIAEAAAGVGQTYQAAAGFGEVEPFEASAGMGEYFTEGVSGLGNVATLPTRDTWVPGMADPQIWAGVKAIAQPQSSHAMTRAGVLTSGGNQGVFG